MCFLYLMPRAWCCLPLLVSRWKQLESVWWRVSGGVEGSMRGRCHFRTRWYFHLSQSLLEQHGSSAPSLLAGAAMIKERDILTICGWVDCARPQEPSVFSMWALSVWIMCLCIGVTYQISLNNGSLTVTQNSFKLLWLALVYKYLPM